ncbi:LuxR C-terminal-related transcriptional regulator [Kitasatospora sp. NPDC092948]|uniref:LuxR C-terminal-related transcriptional regulator n=1 Tax=Kitasatospora sp. NPDC092948 TaxID=3364088 RepID=UPI00381525DD
MDIDISPEARALYTRVAAGEPISDEDQGAAWQLLNRGLLREDPGRGLALVDPGYVGARWEAEYHGQAAALLAQAATVSDLLADLRQAYDGRSVDPRAGLVDLVRGSTAINARIGQLLDGCTTELLVCQPGGARSRETLEETKGRDIETIQRGVAVRTLYHADARTGEATELWVAEMTKAGAEIRTLAEPFQRMILIDRSMAVIPGNSILTTSREAVAYVVNDPGVTGFLAANFERDWSRAAPWTGLEEQSMLTPRHEQILRALEQEQSYEAIGKQMKVSSRTVAMQVAEMKEILGVDTLFGLACKWRACAH